MRYSSRLLMLALAARSVVSEVEVCSLPARALYVSDGNKLMACAASGSSALSTRCQTACSCRRLENDQNVYGVCLNISVSFECDAAENATQCTQGENCVSAWCWWLLQLAQGLSFSLLSASGSLNLGATESTSASAADIAGAFASDDNSGGGTLKAWQWVLIGLGIALVVGLVIFIFNWFKHRPQRGDNRREVVQSLEQSRSQPKDDVDMLPVALRESQARTATSNRESAARSTTRSHDTNPSQISGFSGGSYRTYAGNPMSSTLTDTEVVAQHQERAFSPISDSAHSVGSSDYSQGVDTNATPNTSLLGPTRGQSNSSDSEAYPSFSSYSLSSEMDSFSSELTVEGSEMETNESAPYPRKKSIEF
ncbi:Diacylglycerol O-acyltransferase 2 [Phytophthora nicotianae]|uniref:Diacylglycerol O-acyltransferase 2 n=1 Tax=Phytophthora nicotianae TaxID=4792 RepID=A0A0W8DA48_PHYNI|nr:Diacylglycerol O-acyltransferase 2 [Phytophthora nicotianae]